MVFSVEINPDRKYPELDFENNYVSRIVNSTDIEVVSIDAIQPYVAKKA